MRRFDASWLAYEIRSGIQAEEYAGSVGSRVVAVETPLYELLKKAGEWDALKDDAERRSVELLVVVPT